MFGIGTNLANSGSGSFAADMGGVPQASHFQHHHHHQTQQTQQNHQTTQQLMLPPVQPTTAVPPIAQGMNFAAGQTAPQINDQGLSFNPMSAIATAAAPVNAGEYVGGFNGIHFSFPINAGYPPELRHRLLELEQQRANLNEGKAPVVYLSNLKFPRLSAEEYNALNPMAKTRYNMGIHPLQPSPKALVSYMRNQMENQVRAHWGIDFTRFSSFARYPAVDKIKLQYSCQTVMADLYGWFPQLTHEQMEAAIPDRRRSYLRIQRLQQQQMSAALPPTPPPQPAAPNIARSDGNTGNALEVERAAPSDPIVMETQQEPQLPPFQAQPPSSSGAMPSSDTGLGFDCTQTQTPTQNIGGINFNHIDDEVGEATTPTDDGEQLGSPSKKVCISGTGIIPQLNKQPSNESTTTIVGLLPLYLMLSYPMPH